MTTWRARFEAGDYPMVCARSGLPADELVPVEATRRAAWPWFLFWIDILTWLVAWWTVDGDRTWGHLPFATGHARGISATFDRRLGIVTLHGVHPAFIAACHEHQATQPTRHPPVRPIRRPRRTA
jgi:hypothetical protein